MRSRRGFSFAELMVVIVVLAIVASIGVPRFNYIQQGSKVRGGRDQVAAYLATARATAIRQGRDARFRLDANTMIIERRQADGRWVNINAPVPLDEVFTVQVETQPTLTEVRYNARGMMVEPAAGVRQVIRVRHLSDAARVDSVCVTALGVTHRKQCL
ncbi:MAG TPA: GspH/FimT family pseudopilin [Gemmatimonadaceae bacterium]|nr:GspH/FimT family pseudopilin [Gemmatimonadaceae bacterium]